MGEPHFCAACGLERKPFARYPWHLCNDCRESAVDHAGRALRCANEGMGGGFVFATEGVEGVYACRGVLALIRGRPVLIHEARFGGVVAEPVPDSPNADRHVVDLRRRDPDYASLRRVDVRPDRSGGTGPRGRG